MSWMPRLSGNGRNLTPEKAPQDRNVPAPRLQAGDVHTGWAAERTRFSLHGVFLPEMLPPASPRNSIEARTLIAVEY